jgi:hypothetical protein
MRTNKLLRIGGVLLAVAALNAAVWAQGETATVWPKKPIFSVRLGSYFTNSSGQIRVDGENGEGTVIELHNLLNVPSNATVFRANADVRILSWFGMEAEYYRVARSSSTTIDEEIHIGDSVFPINQTVSSSLKQSYLDVALKFYLFHRQRWDLGLWAGANLHFVEFSMNAEPSGLAEYRNPWYPVPAIGACFNYSIMPKLFLYGKVGFFTYSDSTAGVSIGSTRFDITLDYYVWKSLGIGVTYEYFDNNVDLSNSTFTGMINNKTSGIQIYGVIGF